MKKNSFFLLALTGLSLASCSSDEVTDVNPGNAIEFQTVVGKSTRAENTTDNLLGFKTWAFTTLGDSKVVYMDGVEVKRESGSANWTYTDTKYWPLATVDFYAVAPKSVNASVSATAQTITDYTVTNATEDLLYATATNVDGKTNPKVALAFKHALSKIVFTAKLANDASIKVNVSKIQVKGVDNKGTLTLSTGAWTSVAATSNHAANVYTAFATATDLSKSTTAVNTYDNAIFLMPQTLNPWQTTANTGDAKIVVTCKVTDEDSGAVLYNGDVYVPLSVKADNDAGIVANTWLAGKIYTYNLVFGQGAGYDENGKPVLVPIDFSVSVNPFTQGQTTDPSMY